MTLPIQRPLLIQRLLPLLALALFVAALWVLHDTLRQFHYHQILAQLRTIPISHVLAAVGLTALSYLLMTGYDRLAVSYIQHPLNASKVTLAAFISYAFSNTIGLSLLTSGSIRYRLYSTWGLSAEEIARIVTFTALTFWLGIGTVAAIVFLADPMAMPVLAHLPVHSIRLVGVIFAALVVGYLVFVTLRKRSFRFLSWELPIPSLRLAGLQLLIGSFDWILAGCVLFVLLPEQAGLPFVQFLGIYLLAQVVALISHVPGGLGVFESIILLSAPQIPADALLGSIVIYRGVYYLLPLALAALLLGGNELVEKKHLFKKTYHHVDRWLGVMVPYLLSVTTLISGAVLLFSGATPTVPGRLNWLYQILPLPVIELSHFLGSLIGVCLLLLARGLQRRIDAAYILMAIFLGTGSCLSLLKGADYEEALLLVLMLAALLPCRRHFYRQSSLFQDSLSVGWIATVLLVVACSIWLGIFAYKHVDYSSELWWQFALEGDAPRSLRATVGATVLLLLLTMAKLLGPAPKNPNPPEHDELNLARQIISLSPLTLPNLALLGDKELLFDDHKSGFVMYGVQGRAWVALGDPVGPPEVARELAWKYREMVERNGGQAVFYEIDTSMLHVYLDMGLTLFKLGENASVPLTTFSFEGADRKGLRYTHRHLTKEGCRFEVIPSANLPELLPELRKISDDWLQDKHTREKRFSLGSFDEQYLLNFPVAVVKQQDKIVAFANLWMGANNQDLSFDLMRFGSLAPRGVMDFLFIGLMLWGKEQGYRSIDLGMAPLSGLDNRTFAPLWNRVGAVVFQHGEHFYNFEGLREYKEKFKPVWTPRYLACPGGLLALPRILVKISTLISGSIKGVVAK
jgi:phosphatidylglycerol lysyltransferase